MSNPLTDLLAEKGTLLADGATGTNLFNMGLMSGDAPEMWNTAIGQRYLPDQLLRRECLASETA